MDFSQFNGSEQAHMTRVIEKKQVGFSLCSSMKKHGTKSTLLCASVLELWTLIVETLIIGDLGLVQNAR